MKCAPCERVPKGQRDVAVVTVRLTKEGPSTHLAGGYCGLHLKNKLMYWPSYIEVISVEPGEEDYVQRIYEVVKLDKEQLRKNRAIRDDT